MRSKTGVHVANCKPCDLNQSMLSSQPWFYRLCASWPTTVSVSEDRREVRHGPGHMSRPWCTGWPRMNKGGHRVPSLSDLQLLQLQVEALYTHDRHGRMCYVNEPGGARAPRFFFGRTRAGHLWRDDVAE